MKTETYTIYEQNIRIPIPESYHDCMLLIRSDRYREGRRGESVFTIICKSVLQTFFCLRCPCLSVLFWLRLTQYKKGWLRIFCRVMYAHLCKKYQIDIPIRTKIGYGLYIGHGFCMVVNGGTIIGNNVNLSHYLSIGTNHQSPAIIGDGVYIGPNVSLVENVKIGCYARIGAGAVVTKDVPTKGTAVGVPAHVINTKGNNPVNPFPIETIS